MSALGRAWEGPTFFPKRENRALFFTILKKREITYTYTGNVWAFGDRIDLWGSAQ